MLQKMKVYTIDAMSSNSMKSSNPNSGIHETQTAKCLDTMCLDPSCNQGGCMVVIENEKIYNESGKGYWMEGFGCLRAEGENRPSRPGHIVCYPVIALEGNGARPSHMGKGFNEDGTMYTLNTIEQHSICYTIDCRNAELNTEISGTLQAKENGGWSINFLNPVLTENKHE